MADPDNSGTATAEIRPSGPGHARALVPGLVVILLVLALDQASKYWILESLRLPERPLGQIVLSPLFSLSYVENRGVSFGLLKAGSGFQAWALAGLSLAITTLFGFWLARATRFWQVLGLSLAIGGAIGNMIDRLRFHYVVDFLDFSGLFFPWVFNIADAAISVGAGLLLLDLLLPGDQTRGVPATPAPEKTARQDENASIKPDFGEIG